MNEREIFAAALQMKKDTERSAYLERACGGDISLRRRIDELFLEMKNLGSFLESPIPDLIATGATSDVNEQPGTMIGAYKLLEQIGEGGFGDVYMAEQSEPVCRKVALKVIKPGMDTKEVIARFEAERQALAMMDHPNIARVFDAGSTESGRPYFVMELVRGISITEYCDQHNLTTRQRLELFAIVCQAVQHAHQKGIIHRDIKPSNVMVTMRDDTPVPKIIDFGVAKATGARLTEKTFFTRYAQMVGTPLYMSPEQAQQGEWDVDTRSDIYSLGVLLYELLTGTTPFESSRLRQAAYDELLRIIREEEPPKPSTRISTLGDKSDTISAHRKTDPSHLSKFLRGDLDWIVMKALEKDRRRRYETASGFAEDVQRYLNDEPVVACPPTAMYRFRKFARRNKKYLATSALIGFLLVVGTAVSTWMAIRANREKSRHELLTEAERISSSSQKLSGWREESRKPIFAASVLRSGEDIAEVFSRTLSGVDAKIIQKWSMATGRVVFDRDDSHLVLAKPGGGADIVELETGDKQHLKGPENSAAMGPIGFDPAGQVVQANCISPSRFDVSRLGPDSNKISLELPTGLLGDGVEQQWSNCSAEDKEKIRGRLDEIAQANPDLSRMVCWHGIPNELIGPDDKPGKVVLWDINDHTILQMTAAREPALAIAPDGSLFAIGRIDGHVEIRGADAEEPLLVLSAGNNRITAMAFGRDPRKLPVDGGGQLSQWLLAAADESGTIRVWDLSSSVTINVFHGVIHTINALKFSQGSLIFVSAGHGGTKMWDTFGGNHILSLNESGHRKDIAWSFDGSMLASDGVGSRDYHEAQVWKIESDRGIKTMRGMTAAGAKVVFSADSRQIAAVANDWTIGIWDVESQQMKRQLRAPRGYYVDNCDLRFSNDGSSFYFSAGRTMTQWDLTTGAQIDQWQLPPGLQDRIGITADGRVLLMRFDTERPKSGIQPEHPPGVCRLREIMRNEKPLVIGNWKDFTGRIFSIACTRDGSYFAMDGITVDGDRHTLVVDGYTRKQIAHVPGTHVNPTLQLVIADTAGFLMQYVQRGNREFSSLFQLADGRLIDDLPFMCNALSPNGQLGFGGFNDLFDLQTKTRLIRFQLPSPPSQYQPDFSPDNKFVAWANLDGTVSVCDLEQVREELEQVNKGR